MKILEKFFHRHAIIFAQSVERGGTDVLITHLDTGNETVSGYVDIELRDTLGLSNLPEPSSNRHIQLFILCHVTNNYFFYKNVVNYFAVCYFAAIFASATMAYEIVVERENVS